MKAIDNLLAPHATALSVRQKRMEVLGANIANAATPNYKARDIDFASAYGQAMSATGSAPDTMYRTPVSNSLDGNTVELHVEQLQFAENATRYEASLQFLSDRIRGLRTALRGE
jgi:flagellar basal-body rod protein FlgB